MRTTYTASHDLTFEKSGSHMSRILQVGTMGPCFFLVTLINPRKIPILELPTLLGKIIVVKMSRLDVTMA